MTPPLRQFPPSGHVIVAVIASTALLAFMMFWTLAYLRRVSGGLTPFDLRPFGYSFDEARAFLFAISDIGRNYYLDVQLQVDTVAPAVYALSRCLLLLWVTQAGRTSQRPLPFAARVALLALPIITVAFDYAENRGIEAMLTAGPRLTPEMVASASFWTQAKWLAAIVTELTCAALLALALVRWRRRRAQMQLG
jgi:hypothetical protein